MWDIEAARTEARRLAVVVRSDGNDSRELERQQITAKAASIAATASVVEADQVAALTMGDIWPRVSSNAKTPRSSAIVPHWYRWLHLAV